MKVSNYNFFFPYEADESKVIAYNSYSNALALMDKAKYESFQQFVQAGVPLDDGLVTQLKQGSFVVDDDVNELDRLRLRMLKSRYNTDFLSLTIAPTADCMLRCPYCYEKDVINPQYMTPEVEECIIKLVGKHMKTISHLYVTWYGGEPLMNMDTVERLSRKLISLCDENNVRYGANMISNGYLLNREVVQLLVDLKIGTVQVTLDGDEEVHNKRRPHADGSNTFSVIIQNLVDCKDIMPAVSLRINLDKNNITSGSEVTRLLEEKRLIDKVKPYIARIYHANDVYEKTSCFDTCGFSNEEFNYLSEFEDGGYMRHYPKATKNYCGADSLNSYVIGADGSVYKCWHDIGNLARATGSLLSDMDIQERVYLDYMLFDPTVKGNCSQCKLLPVCMGGCPYYRADGTGDVCVSHKYVLNGFLKVISKKLKLKKDLEAEQVS